MAMRNAANPAGASINKKQPSPPPAPGKLLPFSSSDVRKTLEAGGGFGKIVLVTSKRDKKRLFREIDLAKLLSLPSTGSSNSASEILQLVTQEAEELNRHAHPNIVRIYKTFRADEKILFCQMEYCDRGSLEEYLQNRNGELLDEEQIANWFSQIALAVNYFTDQKLSHCDLTAKNIYLKSAAAASSPSDDGDNDDGTGVSVLKVGDYCANHLKTFYRNLILKQQPAAINNNSSSENLITNMNTAAVPSLVSIKPGNVGYLAPEILQGTNTVVDEKADVWTLGILLFQMGALKIPFAGDNAAGLLGKIKKEERDVDIGKEEYSEEMRDLIDRLLQIDPNDRPSIGEILKDRFIRIPVLQLTGGRGWTAFQREEDAALKKARKDAEFAKQKELSELLNKSQTATLKSDFENKFSGPLITSPWFSAPSAIADLLILHAPQNTALVICVNGDIFAVVNDPTTNRSKLLWRGSVNVPQNFSSKTSIEHAACDQFDGSFPDIYFTLVEDRSGIFHVNVKQLKAEFNMKAENPTTVFAKQYLHEKGRKFFGLAVSSKAELLFCCDQSSSNYDIGVWSTKTRKLVARVNHPGASGVEFQPLKCAVFWEENLSKMKLAVTDIEHSMVYVFTLILKCDDNNNKTSVRHESVQTLAKLGTTDVEGAFVNCPRGVFFDYSGEKLFVADELNKRIQVFLSKTPSDESSWKLVATIPTPNQSFLRIKVPGIGVLLEDIAGVKNPADFRPFVLQAFSWQCQILAHFQPPGVL